MKFPTLLSVTGIFCAVILAVVAFDPEQNDSASVTKKKKRGKNFDKPLQFLDFHRELRTPDDKLQPEYEHGYKLRELLLAEKSSAKGSATSRTKTSVEWTERGPANVPGRTRALLDLSKVQPRALLAGAATGGIWKSTNEGDSWVEKNENLSTLPISSFAADKNFNVIYAGTGEYISSIYSAIGDGILFSGDAGETWNVLPSTQGNADFSIVTRVITDPNNPNVVLATTVPSVLAGRVGSLIMRSSNGGATWTKVLQVNRPLEQIIYSPADFQVQYATENGVGVWKSDDGGVTWKLSNKGMHAGGRIELAISPVNASRLYASAEGSLSETESDLYVSHDAGESWGLVDLFINGVRVDFLGNDPSAPDAQGFYDNTIMCDPFKENVVYVGGVNLFQFALGPASGTLEKYSMYEESTDFLFLQAFSNVSDDNGRLLVAEFAEQREVELRFGPGRKQLAHRFLVPENKTSGVPATEYTYQDYIEVPFEAWDVSSGRQIMVSFRDQNRNGTFDLVPQFLTSDGSEYLQNSREYLYFHDLAYHDAPDNKVAATGGHEYRLMYNMFPCLASGKTWAPNNLPKSKVRIETLAIQTYSSSTQTVADAYRRFDGKNRLDQVNLNLGVHPDHHALIPVIVDAETKNYKLILANDGGVFVSNTSTTPGTTDKSWSFKGFGLNTGQFYGADKKPGKDVYIGGMQDNGTRISSDSEDANVKSNYRFAIAGDGFETLWHSRDEKKILGTTYFGYIYRSLDGGVNWSAAYNGLSVGSAFPFVTKLAGSKDYPERVFTISGDGVHYSENFGQSWSLTRIRDYFVTTSLTMLDAEVSRANANIVWAGSGMSNSTTARRHLFVSEDGGRTYKATSNFEGATLGSITKLASHPSDPRTAYALFSFSGRPKILRTTNLGESWHDISGFGTGTKSVNGFPDVAVFCLYVRPDDPQTLWAGTEIGIFESTDNGETWSIIDAFPRVAVWDMKGQDNQVVVATHGRGIWTATLSAPQSNDANAPVILAGGTSSRGEIAVRVNMNTSADSVLVMVDGKKGVTKEKVSAGQSDFFVKNGNPGTRSVTVVAYIDGVPFQSAALLIRHLAIEAVKETYSTTFTVISDFRASGFSLQTFSNNQTNEKKSLHTAHPYANGETYSAALRIPLKVSATFPKAYYSEVVLTEPGKDQAMLRATINGLDWVELTERYDASFSSTWNEAFLQSGTGSRKMLQLREVSLTPTFNAGDTILLDWVLKTNASTTGWGWAIDFISLQEPPVAVETAAAPGTLSVYPNPARGSTEINYHLARPSGVQIRVLNMAGGVLMSLHRENLHEGNHREVLALDKFSPGVYTVLVWSRDRKEAAKLVVY
jgi:hypothetical protein